MPDNMYIARVGPDSVQDYIYYYIRIIYCMCFVILLYIENIYILTSLTWFMHITYILYTCRYTHNNNYQGYGVYE